VELSDEWYESWLAGRATGTCVCVCVCVFGRREMTSSFITAILQHSLHRGTHCPVHTAQPDPTRPDTTVLSRRRCESSRPDCRKTGHVQSGLRRSCAWVHLCDPIQPSPSTDCPNPTQPSSTDGSPQPVYRCGPRGVGRAGGQLDA